MLKAFLPGICWGLTILLLSAIPGKNLPSLPFDLFEIDKLEHAVSYGLLAFLLLWGLHRAGKLNTKWKFITILGCCLYGILIEIAQFCFFSGRYFEVNDIVANIIGSFGSLLLIRFFKK